MSPNVGNFVQDLVEMAKATEELPHVRIDLHRTQDELAKALDIIASREEHILRLKAEIETLQSDKNKLEAQRDDAEYRFLEADERTTKALDFVKTMFGSAGALVQALEPPRPVEAKQPEPEQPKAVDNDPYGWNTDYNPPETGRSAPLPPAAHMMDHQSGDAPTASTTTTADASVGSSLEGQSADHPTPGSVNVPITEMGERQETARSSGASTTTDAPSTDPAKPYAGLNYSTSQKARGYKFVSLSDWIAGGGSEEGWYA